MRRNPGFEPDHVRMFSGGGRVEIWDDGEVCVFDPMDRDLDDYHIIPGDVPKLVRLIAEPLARWHHFMRDMVADDVSLLKRRRKNPMSFHARIRAILSRATPAKRNPMARRRTSKTRKVTKKQRRAARKVAWRKQQAKRLAKTRARKARKTPRRVARKAVRRTSRKVVRRTYRARGRKVRKARKAVRGRKSRRRNPGVHHFKGGMASYQDDGFVSLTNDYGQSREYELSSRQLRSALPRLGRARSFSAAERALGRGAILRQVNPRRRGRGRRRNAPVSRRTAGALRGVLRSHGYRCNPRRRSHGRRSSRTGRYC